MSEQTPVHRSGRGREGITAKLRSLRPYENRIFGPAEIAGLAGSILILLLVIVGYFYLLLPANSRLEARQSERSLLQAQLRTSQDVVQKGETAEASAQKISQSLIDFEDNQLLSADRGRMSLYDRLNVLIRKHNLRNTSGPTYTPLDPADSKAGTSGSKAANTKWQSLYPGIAISVTVEGPYQNLRRFIRELETNTQFIIINSVELERSTETSNSSEAGGDGSSGAGGSVVSLRLEMTTYFQRAARGDQANSPAAQ